MDDKDRIARMEMRKIVAECYGVQEDAAVEVGAAVMSGTGLKVEAMAALENR